MKNANIVRTCPKCFAFVADLKAHRKWHKHNRPIPGPPGPQGPQGAMGMTGTPGRDVVRAPGRSGSSDLLEGVVGDGG